MEPKKTFFLIQALRGLAALFVVLFHGTLGMQLLLVPTFPIFIDGNAGVDIFFVISGFVMTISSTPLLRQRHAMRTFLVRRLERIAPLYWLMTALQLLVFAVLPVASPDSFRGWGRFFSSILFLPSKGYPIVNQGWTLTFEMFFYLLFSLTLTLKIKPLVLLAPALVSLSILSNFLPEGLPAIFLLCSPMLLEFLFGIVLAEWFTSLEVRSRRSTLLLLGFGLIVLMAIFHRYYWRPIRWGLPATLLVACAIVAESKFCASLPRWLLRLGDASYSIYLVHYMLLGFLIPLFPRAALGSRPGQIAAVAFYFLISIGAGELFYRFIEFPIFRYFRAKRQER